VSVNDQGQCGGGVYTFKATGGAVYDWYDAPTGGNLLYTGDTYTTSPLTQTTSFYVSGTLNGITSPRKKVTATVWPIPELMCDFVDKVYTGDDHSFALKTSAGTPPYTYTFDFGDQTIIDTQAADTIHHYLSTGTFHVNAQVKDAKGCVAACGGYVVAAAEDVLIPNVITPDNGDPLNPIFTLFIKENDVYNIYKGPKPFSLQIMNRWGKEIFHTGDAKAGWHGLGEASGTYYYNINFGDRKFKGWVQVIK
jgi:hypothetical protein